MNVKNILPFHLELPIGSITRGSIRRLHYQGAVVPDASELLQSLLPQATYANQTRCTGACQAVWWFHPCQSVGLNLANMNPAELLN